MYKGVSKKQMYTIVIQLPKYAEQRLEFAESSLREFSRQFIFVTEVQFGPHKI